MTSHPFATMSDRLSDFAREYVNAVGMITIASAYLELALDCLIALEGHLAHLESKMPRTVKSKTKHLMKRLKEKSPYLTPYVDEVIQIIVLSDQASNRRNEIIHGAVLGTMPQAGWKLMRFVRIEGEDDIAESPLTTFDFIISFQLIYETALHTYNLIVRLCQNNVLDHDTSSLVPFDVTGFQWPAVHYRAGELDISSPT